MPTTFRPDLGVLVSRWSQQPPPAQLRPVYDELANVATEYRARYWLQDIRHRAYNDPATTRWLFDIYFQRMAAQLQGRLHVAYLANPALLHSILTSPSYLPAESYDNRPFVVSFFNSEGDAYDWLAQQRAKELA